MDQSRTSSTSPPATKPAARRKKKRPRLALHVALAIARSDDTLERDMDEVDREGPANLREHICRIHEVGRGAGGTVSLGIFVPTLKLVAVKEVSVVDEEHEKRTMDEVHAVHEQLVPIDREGCPVWLFHYHRSIGDVHPCPNIVSFYGSYADRAARRVQMVLEYMHGGSLGEVVERGGLQSEPLLRFIARSCLRGLAHMAEHETVHRDVKPCNILVNHDGDVKLGDLGLACHVAPAEQALSSGACDGTAKYLSPERVSGREYSFPADVWALGLSLGSHQNSGVCRTIFRPKKKTGTSTSLYFLLQVP